MGRKEHAGTHTQHMKEQGKNTPDLTNEDETRSLLDKKLRIMIVNMIQNLGNRMEAWTEKIQEIFNKDLEELKKKETDEQHNN